MIDYDQMGEYDVPALVCAPNPPSLDAGNEHDNELLCVAVVVPYFFPLSTTFFSFLFHQCGSLPCRLQIQYAMNATGADKVFCLLRFGRGVRLYVLVAFALVRCLCPTLPLWWRSSRDPCPHHP